VDFELSDDQRLLRDSVEGLLKSLYRPEDRRRHMAEGAGWSRQFWTQLADQGLLGLPFDEADGGFGAGPVETMIVMEAFGRALVVEPYLSTVVLCGGMLRLAGSDTQNQHHIARIADGSLVLALAHAEEQSGHDLEDVATTAVRTTGGWRISGRKIAVQDAAGADMLAVTARTSGSRRDHNGLGVFLVPADAAGLVPHSYPLQDGRGAADVTFDGVEVPEQAVLGDPERGLELLTASVDRAQAALCAEAVGAMDEALRLTVDYLKTRRQFGAPLGSFQALQHRAADMFVCLEQARSMSFLATMAIGFDDPRERSLAISAARVQVAKSSRLIGQQAIQLHGGVGMAMETPIGHYFKRLSMIEMLFGGSDYHLRALGEAVGDW